MVINFNNFTNYVVSFFRSNVLPSFTSRQNKIFLVASVALGFLAAAYVIKWGYFKAKAIKDTPPVDQNSRCFPVQHLLEEKLISYLRTTLSPYTEFNASDLCFNLAKEFAEKKYSERNLFQNVQVVLKQYLCDTYGQQVPWCPVKGKQITDIIVTALKTCVLKNPWRS